MDVQGIDIVQTRERLRVRYPLIRFALSNLTINQILAGQFLVVPITPFSAPVDLVLPSFSDAKAIKVQYNFSAFAGISNAALGNYTMDAPLKRVDADGTGSSALIEYDGIKVSDSFTLPNTAAKYLSRVILQKISIRSFFITVAWNPANFIANAVVSPALAGNPHNVFCDLQATVDIMFTNGQPYYGP